MSEDSIFVKFGRKFAIKALPYYVMHPKREIEEAMSRKDWFGGFAIAVSYFELLGFLSLIGFCKSLGQSPSENVKDELKRINVKQLIALLCSLGLISRNTYSKMNKTISERNKLVHFLRGGVDYRDRKQEDRAKTLLKQAIECIYALLEND